VAKLTFRTALILLAFSVFGVTQARAQQAVNVFFGMGSATDKATPIPLTLGGTDFPRSSMGGVFGSFGGDVMFTPSLGFGGEYAFRFAQADYVVGAGLKARPAFYDFNVVYQPMSSRHIVPVLQAGLGGARVNYYLDQQICSALSGCSSSSTLVDQASHFQFHLSAGVKLYVHGNIFVRPQFDAHWIKGFNSANAPVYGNNWVPQYTVAIGYTFGR
jgi:Outer membrane protein beta-barrel domain